MRRRGWPLYMVASGQRAGAPAAPPARAPQAGALPPHSMGYDALVLAATEYRKRVSARRRARIQRLQAALAALDAVQQQAALHPGAPGGGDRAARVLAAAEELLGRPAGSAQQGVVRATPALCRAVPEPGSMPSRCVSLCGHVFCSADMTQAGVTRKYI